MDVGAIKSRKVLAYLKSKNTDLAFIQESHLMRDEEAVKFKKGWVGKVYYSSYSWERIHFLLSLTFTLSSHTQGLIIIIIFFLLTH